MLDPRSAALRPPPPESDPAGEGVKLPRLRAYEVKPVGEDHPAHLSILLLFDRHSHGNRKVRAKASASPGHLSHDAQNS